VGRQAELVERNGEDAQVENNHRQHEDEDQQQELRGGR
jgi:hypothetical protein